MRKDNRHSEGVDQTVRPVESAARPARCFNVWQQHENTTLACTVTHHVIPSPSAIELLLLHKSVVDDE